MSKILILIIILAIILLALAMFGPREPGRFAPQGPGDLPEDLDGWLADRDQAEGGPRPEVAERIKWAGRPGEKTPLAIVYLHGFSATSEEVRPVPDLVAMYQGANLYFARFAGHGRDGAALADASAADWAEDTARAIEIGAKLGERVVVMATSTGGTMATLAAADPQLSSKIDALVLISPNYGLANPAARLLRWPLARYWAPLVGGRERCFTPINAAHETYWTTCYPTVAALPMAAVVAEAVQVDPARLMQPALFVLSDSDRVVRPDISRKMAEKWGGPAEIAAMTLGLEDDADAHVIAGDVMSPGMTAPVATRINRWLNQSLGLAGVEPDGDDIRTE